MTRPAASSAAGLAGLAGLLPLAGLRSLDADDLAEPLQLQAAMLSATSRHQEHLERGRRLAEEVEALTERASRLTVRLAELAEQERVWAERVEEETAPDPETPEVA